MSELSRLTEVVLLGCRTRRNRSRSPTRLEPTFSPLDEVGLRLGCTCGGWLRGLLLWDGNVGASGKDLVRAAHAPGGVDLGVRFCDSLGGGTGMGMRVGNRPDGVARASYLYTNRRPVRGNGKSEHVKLSCEFFGGPLGGVRMTMDWMSWWDIWGFSFPGSGKGERWVAIKGW